jgi:hypothetical protein
MIEMELNKIVIDEKRHDQLIVLKEKNGDRLLPIVIGLNEVAAIKTKISGFNPPRPITHDLLCSIINSFGATIERIIIDKLENNVFHAKLILKSGSDEKKVVDARPSDCIALAVRTHAPIFVEETVLKQMEIFNKEK